MRHFNLFVLTFMFVGLLASAQTTPTKTPEISMTDWQFLDESGYSIQYPQDWDLNKSGQMGMSFILLSKQTSQQDNFQENVNLLIQDLKGQNINLEKFTEISVGQIKTMVTKGKLIESKKLSGNGNEFQSVIYTGVQGNYKLKFEQYYWIKNDKAYILTLTCELDQFKKYKSTGEKILNSFKLK
jgi:hypothetical protein